MVTFENPEILNAVNEHPANILRYIGQQPSSQPGSISKVMLLIDEVQYANDPSNFLKYHYDLNGDWLKIVATGSSAFYLDTKFHDSLAGRKRIFELFPLDFEEFLQFKGFPAWITEWEQMRQDHAYTSLVHRDIFMMFDEYISYGGYPAVVLENDPEEKKEILRDLVKTYLKRDVLESSHSDFLKICQLLQVLASQAGQLLNSNELSNSLRFASATIENYLYILQKCYHIHLVRPFYQNLRKELSKMPKVYFNDHGFRNALINQWERAPLRIDKGQVTENFLYIRLRQLYGHDIIRYWRTINGNEIDFIGAPAAGEEFAMESKYKADAINPSKYKVFANAYPAIPIRMAAYETINPDHSLFRL